MRWRVQVGAHWAKDAFSNFVVNPLQVLFTPLARTRGTFTSCQQPSCRTAKMWIGVAEERKNASCSNYCAQNEAMDAATSATGTQGLVNHVKAATGPPIHVQTCAAAACSRESRTAPIETSLSASFMHVQASHLTGNAQHFARLCQRIQVSAFACGTLTCETLCVKLPCITSLRSM